MPQASVSRNLLQICHFAFVRRIDGRFDDFLTVTECSAKARQQVIAGDSHGESRTIV
jgi:hypothetical protein